MSELLIKLWQNGILQLGIWETVYMTLISTFFAYLIGLPVGLILRMTDRDGIHPIGWLNRTLGIIVNALRSIPFIILMVAMLPVAKFVVGTSLGNRAVIVTLVIAAAPYVARMVESAAKEVNDFRTMKFLDWFIDEQLEEEVNATDMVTKMKLFGSDAKGLYMLNSELKARVYAAPSLVL